MKCAWSVLAAIMTGVAAGHAQMIVNPGQPAVGNSLTVSTLTTGTVLDIRGVSVSPDRRYVTMNVNVGFSSLDGIDTFGVGGSIIQLPRTTNVQTGGTFVAPAGRAGGAVQAMGMVQVGGAAGQLANVSTTRALYAVPGGVDVGVGGAVALGWNASPPAATGVRLQTSAERVGSLGLLKGVPETALMSVPAKPQPQSTEPVQITFVENDKTLLTAISPALKTNSLTLRQALNTLAKQSKTNIVLGSAAVRQAGIDEKAMLTLDLPEQTLKASLTQVLQQAAPGRSMIVQADEKVVFITTQAQGDNMIVTKTYYQQDLLANASKWSKGGKDVSKPSRGGGATGVMEMILTTVRPEIWKANGGKIGEIYQVNDQVTITAPASVHALLDGPKVYNPNAAPTYVGYGGGGAIAK